MIGRLQLAYNLLWVSNCAYVGVLARVGLSDLAECHPVLVALGTGYFVPNILGSFAMGFFAGLQHPANPFFNFFVGVMTGFCGSCTTFATWQFKNALELLRLDVVAALAHILTTFTASFMALRLGKHLAAVPKRYFFTEPASQTQENTQVVVKTQFTPNLVLLLVNTSCIWCLIFFGPEEQKKWFVAMSFAPIGAGVRYLLSLGNHHFRQFPLFTFIPNVLGTVVNMAIALILNCDDVKESNSRSEVNLWLGKGLGTGCMGSLSTVSTWVNELDKLVDTKDTFWAYVYGLSSIIVAQMFTLFIGGIWLSTGHTLL